MNITDSREFWIDCYGFEDFYEVSNLGNVRSKARNGTNGHTLKPFAGNAANWGNGYPMVTLSVHGKHYKKFVHILVAESFYGPRPPKNDVRHLNDIKTDNRACNLAYGTRSQNIADAYRNGARKWGDKAVKITPEQAVEIAKSNARITDLCKQYGVTAASILDIKKGVTFKGLTEGIRVWNRRSKTFSAEEIVDILNKNTTAKTLAAKYGVSRWTIDRIRAKNRVANNQLVSA